MKNLTSICLTSYNRADLICDTLDSVYLQIYRPIEVVICDDASTDDSLEILNNWKSKFQSDCFIIHILRNEVNMGAPYSRNRAIQKSSGSFIQFLDSDDLLHPQKLSIQVDALLRNPDAQCAWNPLSRFSDNDLPTYDILNADDYSLELRSGNPFDYEFLPSAALHRSFVFAKTGLWNEKLRRWQDLEYHVRLIKNVDNILIFDKPLYFFRQHKKGRINDQYKRIEGVENGLLTLSYVECFLMKNFEVTRNIKLVMYQFYFSLYLLSLSMKNNKHQIFLLRQLLTWSPNNTKLIKTLALFLINCMPSLRWKRIILKKYLLFD